MNKKNLKKLIYTKLTGDMTLQTLLGGAGKIKYANEENLSEYPCVVFRLFPEIDEPYNPSMATGIIKSHFLVESITRNVSSELSGQLSDRIYALLHGQSLSNTDVMIYSCYRSRSDEIQMQGQDVWKVVDEYEIVNKST